MLHCYLPPGLIYGGRAESRIPFTKQLHRNRLKIDWYIQLRFGNSDDILVG